MNTIRSRRGIAELLVCATFVAAVAAQPALAAPPADKDNHGLQTAPGQAKAPAAAAAPAAAPAAGTAKARPAKRTRATKSSGSARQQRSRTSAAGSTKASTTTATTKKATTTTGRTATTQQASSTPAATNGSNSRASRTALRAATRTAGATTTAAGTTASGTQQAAAVESAAAARRASLRSSARQAAQRRPPYLYELLSIAPTTGVLPTSLIGASQSSAQAAELGVRARGPGTTARPQASGSRAEPLEQQGRSPLSRAFRDVVEVIPAWVWIALALLTALVVALGVHTVLAGARTRRLERQRTKLMEDIGLLQEALLPAVPARMGRVTTSVAYRPADGLAAGGDFYDAFALPGGSVGLLLGDVSGHGREALAKTALVRFSVRAHLEAGESPREALSIAGRSLDGRLGDDFATVIAAVHDPERGTLTYSSAGHPPPLVVGPPAHAPLTVASAPPIDVGFPTGQRQTVLPMPAGTTVALYSDGLIEARIDGEAIGAERLAEWLAELGPDASAKQLVELVVERADGVRDDLAVVVLHAEPGAAAPAHRIEQLKLDVLDGDGPDLDAFLRAAGVSRAERRLAGRRVSEELAVTGGVMVEVRAGDHPQVEVAAIGGGVRASRSRVRAR